MISVERGRIDVALLGQDGLQRAHAQLHLGQLRAVLVVMIVVVVIVCGHGNANLPRIVSSFGGCSSILRTGTEVEGGALQGPLC